MPQFEQPGQPRFEAGGVGDGAARRTPAPAGGAEPFATDAVLSFEPDAAARAIVFHLIDEGLASDVVGESVRRTVSRIRRRGLRPAIRFASWRMMTNHGRLDWLLSETLTVPLVRPEDDVVSLESRDGK